MIAKDIEAKILAAIETAIANTGVKTQLFGTWQQATVGYLKNAEETDTVATISVSVGTPSRQTFSTGLCEYSGTVVLVIRAELDATGDALLKIAAPIDTLFKTWQGETYQRSFEALDVTGFKAGDIVVSGGRAPALDFANKTITVDWTFTISGGDAD